jgi:hypothetical protein
MLVVQVPPNQIVAVVAVRDSLVSAAGTVPVLLAVPAAGVSRSAGRRVCALVLDLALVDVPRVGVMHVPIVQVVGMPFVLDGSMTTSRPVLVVMLLVALVLHAAPLFGSPDLQMLP